MSHACQAISPKLKEALMVRTGGDTDSLAKMSYGTESSSSRFVAGMLHERVRPDVAVWCSGRFTPGAQLVVQTVNRAFSLVDAKSTTTMSQD